jgi:hypothetical protein
MVKPSAPDESLADASHTVARPNPGLVPYTDGAGTVPKPSPEHAGGAFVSNSTNTVASAEAMSAQLVPLHAPPKPVKRDPPSGVACSVTGVPVLNAALQSARQSMPAGFEVTRPAPDPLNVTFSVALPAGGGCCFSRSMVTVASPESASEHVVPEHAPA